MGSWHSHSSSPKTGTSSFDNGKATIIKDEKPVVVLQFCSCIEVGDLSWSQEPENSMETFPNTAVAVFFHSKSRIKWSLENHLLRMAIINGRDWKTTKKNLQNIGQSRTAEFYDSLIHFHLFISVYGYPDWRDHLTWSTFDSDKFSSLVDLLWIP